MHSIAVPPGNQAVPTSGNPGQRWSRNLQLEECRRRYEDESEINETSFTVNSQLDLINQNQLNYLSLFKAVYSGYI